MTRRRSRSTVDLSLVGVGVGAGCLSEAEQGRDGAQGELERAHSEIENHKMETKKVWEKIQVCGEPEVNCVTCMRWSPSPTVRLYAGPMSSRVWRRSWRRSGRRKKPSTHRYVLCSMLFEGLGSCGVSDWSGSSPHSLCEQLSNLRESERQERLEWEAQSRRVEELHKREMANLRKEVTEDAEQRISKGEDS